ncbi:MAG: hypothetical protein PW792_01970 [Acidobacteriaceae bacterium]|nr:hypothetical protein [Acidobacteriaceae bacterium]
MTLLQKHFVRTLTLRTTGTLVALGISLIALAGCGAGMHTVSSPETAGSISITGKLYGGQQPVTGAAVYLYAASTSGYGAASVSLLDPIASAANRGTTNVTLDTNNNGYVTTDGSGTFNLTGDYNCTAGQYVYLLAQGGNPGLAAGTTNPNISLMSALGSCSFLRDNAAAINVNVNEVTTVAAAYALAQFMTSPTNLGYSSPSGTLPGNALGLTNAFGMINNLVNFTTGTSPGSGQPVAGGNFAGLPSNLTIPSTTINTLANVLANCVNSDPSTSTACSTLFALAKSSTGSTPSDTAQAILNIAHNPGNNVGAIFNQSAAIAPFPTALSTAPNDWNLLVKVTGGGLNYPDQLAADSQGNIWAANNASTSSAVTKISPTGAFLSGTTGFTGGGIAGAYGIAIDASDNAWVTNAASGKGGISKISSTGIATGPFTGGSLSTSSTPRGIAIDAAGSIWALAQASGTGGLNVFASDGTLTNGPIDVGGITTTSQPYGLSINHAGEFWAANRISNTIARLTSTGTAVSGSPYSGSSISAPFALAFDSSSNAWIANYGSSTITELDNTGANAPGSPFNGGGQLNAPAFVAIDGLNTVWVANYSTTSATGCISQLDSTGNLLSPVCYGKGSLPYPHGLAIDPSGNLWVGTGSTSSLLFLVGAAAPVITPMNVATNGGHLGVRP